MEENRKVLKHHVIGQYFTVAGVQVLEPNCPSLNPGPQ